jgi:hypothetical protein
MMSQINKIARLPTVLILKGHVTDVMAQLPKVAKWGVPGAIMAGWFLYPALTPDFKASVGLP